MNQTSQTTYIIADPGEWVSEEQIMALKGLKEGTFWRGANTSMFPLTGSHLITVPASTT